MRFQEKIREYSKEEIWNEYCGFLDISVEEFMYIQKRLLLEQIQLFGKCSLGRQIMRGRQPSTVEEFREMVPLTTYDDYAPILMGKHKESLPAEPILWIQTTWEGGLHPLKVAPYTKSMLDTYKHNMMACFMLATSSRRGDFDISVTDHMLYALAPLPYATGILPLLLHDEIDIEFLPSVKEAEAMTFKERNVRGFKLGLRKGIEYFFGLGSVTYYVSKSLSSMQSSGGSLKDKLADASPAMIARLLRAKRRCKKENRELMPKDLFQLKGFMCAGTDNDYYKDDLEELWGLRPMEIFAGTEPTCIGTETWNRDGMYFFPDACFYEFIPQEEMDRNMEDPSYTPRTVLMDEVQAGHLYEIVITVLKGGAFARYRVGDLYRCMGLENKQDQTRLPRFAYVDRVPSVIDIAGFTRITENSIAHAIELSGLKIAGWTAKKEYTSNKRPLFHLYVELDRAALTSCAVSEHILKEHLSVYFKYLDQDYKDLKKILGMDPLEVTILRCGTFDAFAQRFGRPIRRMNPSSQDLTDLLRSDDYITGRRDLYERV